MTYLLAAGDGPATSFGNEPFWITLVKAVAIFGLLVVLTLLTIWGERRVVGRMQQRVGPNRVGPFGVIQGLADGIKLALKEDIIPVLADRPVFIIAPVVSVIPAFLAFAVVPFGPEVSIAGHKTALQLTDLPVGVLFVLAMSSLGVYGIVLGGWASGSIYPLLGGLRSAAQMISYEISMGLSLVTVFLFAGSLSTSRIVGAQADMWNFIPLSISFIIYAISVVGETNRAPFDLPEAESELVGGFHTEYSSLKFALFFLAEYVNLITVSAIGATLFFGGWRPFWPFSLIDALSTGWWPLVFFLFKVIVGIFVFIWLRGTLPRLRYDQFMKFGWKVLVPVSLVWILLVATFRTINNQGGLSTRSLIIAAAVLAVLVLAVSFLPERKKADEEPELVQGHPAEMVSGGFPVPSLPLRHSTTGTPSGIGAGDHPVVIGAGGAELTTNTDSGDSSAR